MGIRDTFTDQHRAEWKSCQSVRCKKYELQILFSNVINNFVVEMNTDVIVPLCCYRPQRSWGKVMFLHVSAILFTGRGWYSSMHYRWYPSMPCSRSPGGGGGWYPSMPCRFPGPHPGGKLRGLAWGGLQVHTWGASRPTPRRVFRPTPGGSPGPHPGGVSQHALRQTPRQLLLRVVHILLECILVDFISSWCTKMQTIHYGLTYHLQQ